ncbi:MAG TPA: aspartate dehydrogenase [Candidatus Thermoplasmatota archaeon]|nr:aspartate dehydrogenase [Candidatus Thermoplasmatota archaeon]
MDLLILGCGAIGAELARAAEAVPGIGRIYLFDGHRERAERLAGQLIRARVVDDVDEALRLVDLVVEAASQEAVVRYGPRILDAGRDLMILSVGALSDPKFLHEVERLARQRHADVWVPSGAIAGLDALKAVRARATRVELTTSKPPEALGLPKGSARKVLFEGSANDAVAKFPRNVNVAASVSLAGIGSERTLVRVVSDPALARNVHELIVEGDFGRLVVRTENEPSPENPATSRLAYLSAIEMLRSFSDPLKVGT